MIFKYRGCYAMPCFVREAINISKYLIDIYSNLIRKTDIYHPLLCKVIDDFSFWSSESDYIKTKKNTVLNQK